MLSNFSVQRMAAGDAGSQIRVLAARRHRSPPRWTMRRNHRVAFSLVELLVVIAIIGALAALLLGTISKAKSKAQQRHCASNLRQLGLGLQGYVTENHAYPLFSPWVAAVAREGLGISSDYTTGVWRCPAAQRASNLPAASGYRPPTATTAAVCSRRPTPAASASEVIKVVEHRLLR
jgi:prepilin-type N-terminal cleavage/methylation domain-containing protein